MKGIWKGALILIVPRVCQTALFETQKKQREEPTRLSRKQMRVFFLVLLGVTLWQFLPEFVWPMLGSLAFLCWVAPHNPVANFLGAGFGGASMLNLSLDWSSISTNINLFLTPWWTQVIIFAAYVLSCWILLPAAKYGGLGKWDKNLMSNRLYLGRCCFVVAGKKSKRKLTRLGRKRYRLSHN